MLQSDQQPADVCLIVEGAYPYIRGGVSSWMQDLIAAQSHLRFHVLVIVAPDAELTLRYKLPPNVCGLTRVFAGQLPIGSRTFSGPAQLIEELLALAGRLMIHGSAQDLAAIIQRVLPHRAELGRALLLDSRVAWAEFCKLYEQSCDGASFLNAFWGWRTLISGLFSAVLIELPAARVYHSISTGYAGLLAARATLETGRPSFVTEHGVYTNERRLEILAAPWLAVDDSSLISIDGALNKVKELWINTFVSYSRACYQASSHVITLFEGNHPLQVEDGAPPDRLSVIPNGIDPTFYAKLVREPRVAEGGTRPSAIALTGRVVPIKDIKTYIRACSLLAKKFPDIICYVLGPMDEDPVYVAACQAFVKHLHLEDRIVFAGMVNLMDYFCAIDVLVLTSISEAQPLVILEGGAAGVPSVATDVGSCRELIEGRSDEIPNLGPGGRVAAIGNPSEIANAIAELLLDEPLRQRCGQSMRQRVEKYYDKATLQTRYAQLYAQLDAQPDRIAAVT